MKTPMPGNAVRGSKTGVPIMALFDLLGRSWAMGVIWHLSSGAKNFRQLQEYCESVSPTTLNARLKELRQAQLIVLGKGGYVLTNYGLELFMMLKPLGEWSKKWAKAFENVR